VKQSFYFWGDASLPTGRQAPVEERVKALLAMSE